MKILGEHTHLRQDNLRVYEMSIDGESLSTPQLLKEAGKVIGMVFPVQELSIGALNLRENRMVVNVWLRTAMPFGMSMGKLRVMAPGDEKPPVIKLKLKKRKKKKLVILRKKKKLVALRKKLRIVKKAPIRKKWFGLFG